VAYSSHKHLQACVRALGWQLSIDTVASLGLVSPGAVTDDATLFLSLKNWRPFQSSSPLHPLPTFQVIVSQVPLVKFSHKKFYFHQGVNPWMVSPREVRPPPLLVTPLHRQYVLSKLRTLEQGCICQIFTGGSEFRLAMTDQATIAGYEVTKLVLCIAC